MLNLAARACSNRLCLAIIALGTAVAIALFLYIRDNERNQLEHHLQLAFDEHYHAVHAEGDILEKILQSLRALYNASDVVERHEFAHFVDQLALHHHYIKAALWLPRVEGSPPAYPIRFAQPADYEALLGGLDLNSDPALRRQLQEAAGKLRVLVLADEPAPDAGDVHSVQLFLPIYRDDKSLRGFVLLLIEFHEFIDAAFAHRANDNRMLDIAIIDTQREALLFFHPADPRPGIPSLAEMDLQANDYHRPLHILGQNWSILIRPVPGRFPDYMTVMPWFALLATLAITLLVTWIVNSNQTRRAYAESQVAEHTDALQKSEARLAGLYSIVASDKSFADKTRAMLAYGCEQLGLQYGILSHIENGQYTVKYASSYDNSLVEGSLFSLRDTYCLLTLRNNDVTSSARASESEWARHPCYEIFHLESYIGTPIYVNNRLYGTLNFSSAAPRTTTFSQSEHKLVKLMAQWLGMELAHIQYEDRLLEKQNTISHILESTSEAFLAVDRKQKILYANSLTGTLLNLGSDELVGKTLHGTACEFLTLVNDALDDTLYNATSHEFDCYYLPSNKWLEVSINPTLQGASISIRDITEQKSSAEFLSHTLGIKNAILNSANFSIIATHVDGTIMSFNNAAERMLGYTYQEMIGHHTPVLFHDPQEIAARAHELSEELDTPIQPGFDVLTELARRGIPDEQEWTYICRDGSRVPVLLSVTEMTDEKGHCIGFLGIGVDITERKRIERIRDEFVSTVSHELRTPLTSIRGSLGLLSGNLSEQLPPQAHSLIEIAGRNTERLLHLINDILDINKIESGKMTFHYQPLPLDAFLNQALENNQSYARQFNVDLILASDPPQVDLYADEHRLMQVMNNLISNAVKFSPGGANVEIDAIVQGHFVRLSVTDHGKGIPPDFRGKVFQRFSQADASDSRNTGGTGLGLSIAQAIVEQHGGHISFVTQPDIGTTFYFDLPVYRHQAITRIKDQIICVAPPRSQRLLICEDDQDVSGLLQLMLARHGYQSDICASAEAARHALQKHNYDALLLDILLPDRNGLELIRELRESGGDRQLPIIVVSAIANEARSELEGGAADIVDWLDKPLDQERLLHSVQRALSHLPDKPKVLYVEDDTDLQEVIALMLQDQVLLYPVHTLEEARKYLAGQSFDLVLLDVGLPDGSGLELLETLKELRPPPATVIFSNREMEDEITHQVSAALLKSNTSKQTLLETLSASLRQWARDDDRKRHATEEPA